MKPRPPVHHTSKSLPGKLILVGLALLLVAGMFLAGTFLPAPTTPVHALIAPPAPAVQTPVPGGVSGTLASFTALIQDIGMLYLPVTVH